MDHFAQDYGNSIAKAPELPQTCFNGTASNGTHQEFHVAPVYSRRLYDAYMRQ